MKECIAPEQLQRLLAEQLSEPERTDLEAHVDSCARCQERLAYLLDDTEEDSAEMDWRLLRELDPLSVPAPVADLLRRLTDTPVGARSGDHATAGTATEDFGRAAPDGAGPPAGEAMRDILFPDPPTAYGPLGRLESYHIIAQLGRGAFGLVFKAYDEKLDCPVALKVLKPELAASTHERTRFEGEARKAAAVRHDHVVTIHRVGSTPGFALPYFVMEYIDGEPLSDRLQRQGTLPAREAAEIARQVALGLAAAQARGQVHRDIKPSNTLLEKSSGRAKITDFGLARTVEVRTQRLTQSGAIMGSPPYMSPEQIVAPQRVDHRSDVYSLGAVLYEMLTGEPPFRGLTHLVLQQVVHEEPRSLRRLNDTIPRDLETIGLRCLQKEPAKRYASAGALAEDFRRFLAGEPIQARPIRLWERAAKWARRRPAIAALLALVVFVGALGFALVTWQWQAAVAARLALEQNLYFHRIALAHSELLSGNWGRAEEILDRCEERWRGWEYYYLKRLRHAPPLTLPLGERTAMGQGFDLAFSPDSRLLALPSGRTTINIWEVNGSERGVSTPRFILRGHTGQVLGVAFSPDGQLLASTSADNTVKIWHLSTSHEPEASATGGTVLTELRTLEGHTDRVLGVAFSPDQGQFLATASNDLTVKLWNTSTGELLFDLPGQSISHEHVQLAFSPDGRLLAAGSKNNTVGVWDVVTGQAVFTLVGHAQPIFNVTFSPDGRRLASAGRDGMVKVWDLPLAEPGASAPGARASAPGGRALTPRYTLPDHSWGVWCVAFSPNGQQLAVAGMYSGDGVRIYEAATGRLILPLPAPFRVVSVAFSADGRRLASAGLDKMVRLWDTKTGHEILTLAGHKDLVGRVLFSPDGQRLGSASADGTVRVSDASPFDETADRRTMTLHAHGGEVYGLAFSPDGRLASASADKSINIWNTANGRPVLVLTLPTHTDIVFSVAFSPDGRRLVSGSYDGTAKLWDTQNGKVLYTFHDFKGWIRSVAFSPDGQTIATACVNLLQLWDAETGEELNRRFRADPDYVRCVTFSPDGTYVAVVGTTKSAKVWDVNTGEEVSSFPGHLTRVKSVAFHPSGEYVASGDGDFKVMLWDPRTGQEIRTPLSEHTDVVESLAFSPDGRFLATASWREVIIWDAKSFDKIETLGRFAGTIWCVAFSPDGKCLAAGGGYKGKGEIKIWDASLWEKESLIAP